jgi:hypothetical protein
MYQYSDSKTNYSPLNKRWEREREFINIYKQLYFFFSLSYFYQNFNHHEVRGAKKNRIKWSIENGNLKMFDFDIKSKDTRDILHQIVYVCSVCLFFFFQWIYVYSQSLPSSVFTFQ